MSGIGREIRWYDYILVVAAIAVIGQFSYWAGKIDADHWWQAHQNQILECAEPSHPTIKHEQPTPIGTIGYDSVTSEIQSNIDGIKRGLELRNEEDKWRDARLSHSG